MDVAEIDMSGWWPCVERPHLLDPSRVTHLAPRYVPGVGWVVAADVVGGLSVTLVGTHPTEGAARQRAAELRP